MSTAAKHKIVALDAWVQLPPLNFDAEVVQYAQGSKPDEIPERIRDATIVVISGTPLKRSAIEQAQKLQLVACNGVGTDHVDKEAVREKGASVCRVPGQNTDTVAEHAFALYFALTRQIIPMHHLAMDGSTWPSEKSLHMRFRWLPRVAHDEILVIVGYGAIGKYVERVGKALGMNIIIAERKGATAIREGRTSFDDALKKGTVFVLTVPSEPNTLDMFSAREFEMMETTALIINVGRGGSINEHDLATALKEGKIGGAAVDVFKTEPATKESSPLLHSHIPNLILSPHIAWCSSKTIRGTLATVKANLEAFAAGKPQNLVVDAREFSRT